VLGVVAAAGAGALIRAIGKPEKERAWLLDEAIPGIEHYLDVADWEHAYRLAREADARVPGSREIAELWPRLTWLVSITSEPAGATVFRQSYTADTSAWEMLGRTPLEQIRVPYGLSRIRLELDGYRPVLRALGGAHINWRELKSGNPDHLLVGPEVYRLDKSSELPADMVRVPGGTLMSGRDTLRFSGRRGLSPARAVAPDRHRKRHDRVATGDDEIHRSYRPTGAEHVGSGRLPRG
jgi:hypothetical protein